MSAQHSYQSMMNRMENVSYLVLPTCTSSDRSATALKSIQDCTFPLYWIPTHVLFWQGRHSTIPHHRCLVIFESVRAYMFWNWFRGYAIFLSCYLGMWKLTVYIFLFFYFFLERVPVYVSVGLQILRQQVWYSGRQEEVSHITILVGHLSCRGVKSPQSDL